MESAPSITMTTEARQRSLKCEPACDANGNVPSMKSANIDVSPQMKDQESFITNGHLIHEYDENGDDKHHGGRLVNGAATNGIIHSVNGEAPSKVTASSTITAPKLEFPVSVKLLLTAASGVVFGFAMEKGRGKSILISFLIHLHTTL